MWLAPKLPLMLFFFFWYCHWIARILSVLLSKQGLNLSHCSTFTSARLLNNSSLCVFWAQFLNVSPAFVNSFQPQNVVETPEDAPCDRGKDKQTLMTLRWTHFSFTQYRSTVDVTWLDIYIQTGRTINILKLKVYIKLWKVRRSTLNEVNRSLKEKEKKYIHFQDWNSR